MKPWLKLAMSALAAGLIGPVAAAEPVDPVTAELDAAMLRLADAGLLDGADGGPRRIVQPPRVRHELGAVLDLGGSGEHGARVVAVTPEGAAARLGLRVDDRVTAINGTAVARHTDPAALQAALDGGSGGLALMVERDGNRLELRGEADSVALPGYELLLAASEAGGSTCGRINVFDAFPRGRDVYPVRVIAIDGRYPGPGPSFRLKPGPHALTVAELIDSREFAGSVDRYARDRAGRERYKDLTVDVAAGVTYRVAAQFLPEHRHDIRQNAYWEPLIWREVSEPCR